MAFACLGGGVGPLTMWVQVDAENGIYFKEGKA